MFFAVGTRIRLHFGVTEVTPQLLKYLNLKNDCITSLVMKFDNEK